MNYENKNTLPNPAERILALAAEVDDLRRTVQFNRIGPEGMQAIADQNAEQALLSGLESEMPPEATAVDGLFKASAIDALSKELYGGRGYDELNPLEQQRVKAQHDDLHQLSDLAEALVTDQLSAEMDAAFNADPTEFSYRSSDQQNGRVVVRGKQPFPLADNAAVVPRIVVETIEGNPEVNNKSMIVDNQGREVNLEQFAIDMGASDEQIGELRNSFLQATPALPEHTAVIEQGLERVKTYLEGQLPAGEPTQQ